MINAATPVHVLPTPAQIKIHTITFLRDAGDWVATNWPDILIALAIALAVVVAIHFVRAWGLRMCRRGEGAASWYAILGRAIARTGNFFIIMVGVRLVAGFAHAPDPITLTVKFLFTIAATFQAAIWLRELVFGAVEHRTLAEGDAGVAYTSALGIIRMLVSIVLFAIAAVVVLSNLGVNVTGLVAGLGIGGIAIGLAAQGIFADLFAALAILFDRPFRVGDSISYDKGAGSGVVEAIGLKSTRVRGGGGEQRIIANKKLLDFEILNLSLRPHNRFKFDFTLGYGTDPATIERLPQLLRDAVESQGHTLVHGGLNGFGGGGLSYDVEFESKQSDFPADARDKVAATILARFREEGIDFASPAPVSIVMPDVRPAPVQET